VQPARDEGIKFGQGWLMNVTRTSTKEEDSNKQTCLNIENPKYLLAGIVKQQNLLENSSKQLILQLTIFLNNVVC
jgi:hypothetical protein